ncbi:Protein arginine methyltransferase NDUFAF7, mitochondrial [Golovinomyces cichoracearum]|uniref:Protein arginine methyltransferase NDUFAF7 n=1 Tax=Golovinomyces cichoracearum TaxID=62708 RepID=A0A420IG03_9PEZI|nr:Protein arginine methyltransferase NDUFAF7, mitochondrial [Golovinomyces cichoracearum]
MRLCLTSEHGGYYMSSKNGCDQFGTKGDFITSPEISQIFGELVGIWFVAEWMAQGKDPKKGIEIVEVGPGRGTLMDDILRTLRSFTQMSSKIEAIYLIEASPSLREIQKNLLCGDKPMEKTSIGYRSISKYMDLPIIWTENIRFLPQAQDLSSFIVAHEFFDALPIHAFQSVATTEDVSSIPTGDHPLKTQTFGNRRTMGSQWRELVVSPIHTPLQNSPEFQLTLSKTKTPHSLYLPEISPRYQTLKKSTGSLIEISPESRVYAHEFARRIGGTQSEPRLDPSGAAIILDYGPSETIPVNSLRGIREHKFVSPFSSPGLVDLSADVDFVALAEAALTASPGVEVHGPVEQSSFLLTMGIKERAEMLLKNVINDEEKSKRVEGSWKRLVDRGVSGIGKVYKAMAIVPRNDGKRKPVGFGGDL